MADKEARTLRDLLSERGHVGEPEICGLFLDIVRDLETAHAQGSVHGDIKPEKIVKNDSGKYALVDYGVARLGTPKYMSPERARRQATDVRSDIYSLGVVMYEAATGKPPFEGMSYQVMQAHIGENPALPKSVRSSISGGLQRIILTAMAKEPTDRYQTSHTLADALRALAADYMSLSSPAAVQPAQAAPAATRPAGGQVVNPARTPAGTMSGKRPGVGSPPKQSPSQAAARGATTAASPGPAAGSPKPAEARAISSGPAAPSLSARPVSAPSPVPAARVRPAVPRRLPVPFIAGGGVAVVAVVLIILLVGGGSKVPTLVGLSEARASALARKAGMTLVSDGSIDDTLPAGFVAEQRPEPGAKATKPGSLHVRLSTGQVEVPDLVELSVTEAAERLARLALTVAAVDSDYSDRYRVGMVMRLQPGPGSRTAPGASVRLTVAAGRVTCPECGVRRERGAKFCTTCGYRFEL